jgi:hypothetical protein
MTAFGFEEVIRPLSMTEIVSQRDKYLFGQSHGSVAKHAESSKPMDEPEALRTVIEAVKAIYAGKSEYIAVELFTDPKRPNTCSTINVCSMRRVK